MFKFTISLCICERLCDEHYEEAQRNLIKVRGHFRMVNGKKVYVKTHYRKK